MKKIVSSLVLLAIILTAFPVTSVKAEPDVISSKVRVVGVSWEKYYGVGSEELDALLYPSGMRIPTKYMDVFDLIPFVSDVIYDSEVGKFLNRYYPDANGVFTYAEYKAVERLLYFSYLANTYGEDNKVVASLKQLESKCDVRFFSTLTDVRCLDTLYLWKLLEPYKDLFITLGHNGSNITLSTNYVKLMGLNETYNCLLTWGVDVKLEGEDPSGEYCEHLSESLLQFENTISILSLTYVPSSYSIDYVDSTAYYFNISNRRMDVMEYLLKVNNNDSFELKTDEASSKKMSGSDRLLPTSETFWKPRTHKLEHGNNDAFTGLDTSIPYEESGNTAKMLLQRYGVRDVFGALSLVAVSIAIVVLWIIGAIRKRRDYVEEWLD